VGRRGDAVPLEADGPGPFLDLLMAACEIYPSYAAALREETGVDVSYAEAGTLFAALGEENEAELREHWGWQSAAGLPVERTMATEAREAEPALSPALRMALRFPGDHQVDNRALGAALWSAAARAGAEFRLGCTPSACCARGPARRGWNARAGSG
jgi:glycine oxidase